MLDCTTQSDGTHALDGLPNMQCWTGNHLWFAMLGATGLLIYAVLIPLKLFLTVRDNAADGKWEEHELEAHAWLLLKVKAPACRPDAMSCRAFDHPRIGDTRF